MESQPLVSIVIPCFNREEYLSATLESCLNQSYSNLEIIVVDDGSTDSTLSIAKGYAERDHRVKIFHTVNQGPCIARNNGLGLTNGEYIKFLDSDDLLLPYSIQYQVQSLIHFNADITIGKILLFWDEELEKVQAEVSQEKNFSALDQVTEDSYFKLTSEYGFTLNEVLLKREIVLHVGGFEPWLGGANESSLNARILIHYPNIKAVFHNDTVLLLKRIGYYSLAAQNRMTKKIPWALISYQKSAEYFLKQAKDNPEAKRFIFERLYKHMMFAYRQGFIGYVLTAYKVWEQAEIEPPKLQPYYHNWLHHHVGFIGAEQTLEACRNILSPFRSSKKTNKTTSS